MTDLISKLCDETCARRHGEPASSAPGEKGVLLEMSPELWDQVSQAASMDGITPSEFCSRRMAAVVEEQLRGEAERRRRAAEPKPDGRLRFPGGIR